MTTSTSQKNLKHSPAKFEPTQEIQRLETKLNTTLHPVSPRSTFVEKLGQRLTTEPDLPEIRPSARTLDYALMAIAGVLSGVMLVMLGIRLARALAPILAAARMRRSSLPGAAG